MVYSPIMPNMKLTAQDMGAPDYMKALQNAFAGIQGVAETAYKPNQMAEDLLKAQLASKINRPKAEDAQGWYNTEKNYKQALINQANRPAAVTGEIPLLFQLRNSLPEGSDRDRVDQMITRKAQGNQGTTVYDPQTGNPLVQIGGNSGKAGGGTFINPATGEVTSQPTGATASNLQQRVVGGDAVKPYLDKIIETLPQFQNPLNQASLFGQKIANAIGGQNFPLPSQKASGKAAIKEASEGMIKTFGLNATGANRQAMEDILQPHFGESPEGYAQRVREQAAAYATNQQMAKEALTGGIKLNSPSSSNKTSLSVVPKGKIRVFFPDGPHIIPTTLLNEAMRSGATLEQELPNG